MRHDVIFFIGLTTVFGFGIFLGYSFGEVAGRAERRNLCSCGDTRTCPFGPGIVGEQDCRTGLDSNEWGRCEPKERR